VTQTRRQSWRDCVSGSLSYRRQLERRERCARPSYFRLKIKVGEETAFAKPIG
jgi:hypothetical protein